MSAIPYTVERRPDTGVNNVQLGIWLFLASEVMLFGGLFSAYFTLRAGAPQPWAPLSAHMDAALVSTVLLFGATGAFAMALRSARAARLPAFRVWIGAAMLLGLLFVAYKGRQYLDLWEGHFYASTSTQWATYYLLTGVHGLHVLGGVLVNAWLLATSSRAWTTSSARIVNRVEAVALYWYFVDLVWVLLFVLLYVV